MFFWFCLLRREREFGGGGGGRRRKTYKAMVCGNALSHGLQFQHAIFYTTHIPC